MTASPLLLDDDAMRRFIIDGYLVLQPDFPAEYHERIYQQIEKVVAGGNPQNNLLPRVPAVEQVEELSARAARAVRAMQALHLHDVGSHEAEQVRTQRPSPQGTEVDYERVTPSIAPNSPTNDADRGLLRLRRIRHGTDSEAN